eukprot:1786647-Prymnesium_polylepis.1
MGGCGRSGGVSGDVGHQDEVRTLRGHGNDGAWDREGTGRVRGGDHGMAAWTWTERWGHGEMTKRRGVVSMR